MHYYKRNIGDYAKKAGRLTILQHGIYTLLIDACYDREKFPTREEAIDWVWASSQEEIDGTDLVLRKFFELQDDGTYVQNRIKEELEAYQAKSQKNKQIAIDRETKRKEKDTKRAEADTKRERVVNEAPPNHKPITNNHKPITNNQLQGKASQSSPPSSAGIAENPPSIEEVAEYASDYARRNNFNFTRTMPTSFIEYYSDPKVSWIKKNGKPVVDWKATARLWVKRDHDKHEIQLKKSGGSDATSGSNTRQELSPYEQYRRQLEGSDGLNQAEQGDVVSTQ